MPNIAFLSLIYLLLAVPGFLYRSAYFSGEFTRNLLPRSWTDEIGKAILYSIPFHLLWIGLFELMQYLGITHYTMTEEAILRLMAGEYTSGEYSFHGIVAQVSANHFYIIVYYLAVLGSAFFAGWLARQIVWKNELDVKWLWLRYRSEWLYKIMGRGGLKDVSWKNTEAWIDILSEQDSVIPGKAILYRGLAAGYTTEDNGALRDIILTDVTRTGGGKNIAGEIVWTSIPTTFFVVSYAKVRNMNITYEDHSKRILDQLLQLPTSPGPDEPAPQPEHPRSLESS